MRTRRPRPSSHLVSADATEHTSVLLHEVIEALAIDESDTIVDATLGGAGHAIAIAEKLGKGGTLIGIDADGAAVERAKERLSQTAPSVHIVHDNFRNLTNVLADLNVTHIDGALFDLGWSAYHLTSGRGFSFQNDEPLLMTYAEDPKEGDLTAAQIVNEWEEEHIADVLYGWGEETFSRHIAHGIAEARNEKRIETTTELVDIIRSATPAWYARRKVHPATKTFQALRIAVNDEMGAITEGLEAARASATPGGCIVVITFHSIEDRLVKRLFRSWESDGKGKASKKVVRASDSELAENPRARSAKLRTFKTT